jgi:tetratricopeptide (TPR) repeat protein
MTKGLILICLSVQCPFQQPLPWESIFIFKTIIMKKIFFILVTLIGLSCNKEADWLEAKPDKALVVPQTLQNYKALLANEGKMNILDASIGFIAAEPFYLRESSWLSVSAGIQRNVYTWDPYPYNGLQVSDWNNAYQQVYYCNVVLEGLGSMKDLSASDQALFNELLGTALFFRSYAYYKLLSLFAAPYNKSTAASLPGIVLSSTPDVGEERIRSSVADCYDQVINDLKKADSLLPLSVSVKSKPSAIATKALLARIYLSMNDYANSFDYADRCLALSNSLLDYNSLNIAATYPIILMNVEDIFHVRLNTYAVMSNTVIVTDSLLYRSYATNDLRRTIFFNTSSGFPLFKGSYEGGSPYYSGLATDEVYLIRAESNARLGRTSQAMQDLNTLLVKRWKTGTYTPLTAATADQALQLVLQERMKELLFRGLRWTDLRRLNTSAATAITLKRVIGGQTYQLPPGDLRYTFLLPDPEIQLSGLTQNPR